jgi:hypothetical protein
VKEIGERDEERDGEGDQKERRRNSGDVVYIYRVSVLCCHPQHKARTFQMWANYYFKGRSDN